MLKGKKLGGPSGIGSLGKPRMKIGGAGPGGAIGANKAATISSSNAVSAFIRVEVELKTKTKSI